MKETGSQSTESKPLGQEQQINIHAASTSMPQRWNEKGSHSASTSESSQEQQLDHIIIQLPIWNHYDLPRSDLLYGPRLEYFRIGVPLYEASIQCDWNAAKAIFDCYPEMELFRCSITENNETALHVAASLKRSNKQVGNFVKNLVALMSPADMELENSDGDTALLLAAAAGNIQAVKIMVEKSIALLTIPGSHGMMPLIVAASYGNYEVVKFLYEHSRGLCDDDVWNDDTRGWLLEKCVEADMFDVALEIVKNFPELGSGGILGALARKPYAFYVTKPNIIKRIMSPDMSLRDCLHLESFDDSELELTSFQMAPGDKPFLDRMKASSYKIRSPEDSASANPVGASSSAVPSEPARDTGKLPETPVASSDDGKKKKKSRKRKGSEGDAPPEGSKGTPKRMKTPLSVIPEDVMTDTSEQGGMLNTLSDHLDSGKTARDEPHVSFAEGTEDQMNPSPLHSFPGPSSPADSMDLDPAVAEEKFIPNWDIKNGDKILDALTARTMMLNLNTPAEAHRHRRAAPLVLADALMMNQAQSIGLVTEVYRRWVDLEVEKAKVCSLMDGEDLLSVGKKLEELSEEKGSLEKRLEQALLQLKSSGAAAALASEERDKALGEVSSLKAERDAALQEKKMFEVEASRFRSQLDHMRKEMDGQVSKLTESNTQLTGQVKELLELKEWLMTEGMLLVARKIHTSEELKTVVGAINNAMNACGVNVGIKAGYHYSSKGMPMENVPKLKLNADEMLNTALDKFDALEFPFLQHTGRFLSEPLEVIKAAGLSGDLFKPPST